MTSKSKLVLKADLHLHTHEDPKDHDGVDYDSFQLIDQLEHKGFDVFSITLHDGMFDDKMMNKVRDYAKSKGLIFIPGIEKRIEGKHTLILNMKKHDAEKIEKYTDLKDTIEKYKNDSTLIIAAHPYFPLSISAGRKVIEWQECIDCIEYNSFYLKYINFNRKAQIEAKKLGKVIIGNTDAHVIEQIDNTYTNILLPSRDINILDKRTFKDIVKNCSRKQYEHIIKIILINIKKGNVEIKTKPLKTFYVIKTLIKSIMR
ncbi:MAG: PHP-associated domain-containing protein [Candidatus Woesearchaeota archaeon]